MSSRPRWRPARSRFILISTDKAADPSSILGATKRLAEMVVRRHAGGRTRLASVRFGNVLGSRGSLLSVLRSQIEAGGERDDHPPGCHAILHDREEAVGLVLEAAAMADGGDVFVLDMGAPVRIVDLVQNYANQLHLHPGELVIRFTGLRPGEKMDEALVSDDEQRENTGHPKIWRSRAPAHVPGDLDDALRDLYAASEVNSVPDVVACSSSWCRATSRRNGTPWPSLHRTRTIGDARHAGHGGRHARHPL